MSVVGERIRSSKVIQAVISRLWSPDNVFNRDHPEYQRQAGILADAYANEVEKSRQQYLDELPDFPVVPGTWRWSRNAGFPILVQPPQLHLGLTTKRMLEITQVRSIRQPFTLNDWSGDKDYQTPEVPYSTILEVIDTRFQTPASVRRKMPARLRGGTFSDALALVLLFPANLKTESHRLTLFGMSTEDPHHPSEKYGTVSEYTGVLYVENGQFRIDLDYADFPDSRSYGLVASRSNQLGRDSVGYIEV